MRSPVFFDRHFGIGKISIKRLRIEQHDEAA
jgi:hypothetical protein